MSHSLVDVVVVVVVVETASSRLFSLSMVSVPLGDCMSSMHACKMEGEIERKRERDGERERWRERKRERARDKDRRKEIDIYREKER